MTYTWLRAIAVTAGLTLLVLVGCDRVGVGFTKIGDLLAHPETFSAREVRIRGKVASVLKIPFVSTKLYSIQDSSGEITVRTVRDAPLVGSDVRVKGMLDTVALIGEQQVGLHLRESERW